MIIDLFWQDLADESDLPCRLETQAEDSQVQV